MTTAGHDMGSFHISNRIVVLCCAGVSAEDYPCIGFAGCVNASTFYDFMVVTIALVVVVVVITREEQYPRCASPGIRFSCCRCRARVVVRGAEGWVPNFSHPTKSWSWRSALLAMSSVAGERVTSFENRFRFLFRDNEEAPPQKKP